MEKTDVFTLVTEFSGETHGRTDYGKELIFIRGNKPNEYAPLRFIAKKVEQITDDKSLLKIGFVYCSYEHSDQENFHLWFEHQFQRKLTSKTSRDIKILYHPDHVAIFNSLEVVYKQYEILKEAEILINGKNLPVQLGEWYAKGIFGLQQLKSTSQRGFDFDLEGKKIEVKVHWSDQVSAKGIKIKRTSLELSDHLILIYIGSNFLIRDICFLDSDFVSRKFQNKGHSVFLKDVEISSYFFSKSDKHFDKVVNKNALMKFANPSLAVKLASRV
jgi:hypothetical protein